MILIKLLVTVNLLLEGVAVMSSKLKQEVFDRFLLTSPNYLWIIIVFLDAIRGYCEACGARPI